MLVVGDSITFAFDEFRRLRISAPQKYLPLAAFLRTDLQPDLAVLDQRVGLLRRAQREAKTWLGNGCSVDLVKDAVLLESLYGTWPPVEIPQASFWPVLERLRGFLVSTAGQPRPPAGRFDLTRMVTEYRNPRTGRFCFVDHTYFPRDWTEQNVAYVGQQAWQSPQVIRDETTGTWSGLWRTLEVAGYYNVHTGEALSYFPVLS